MKHRHVIAAVVALALVVVLGGILESPALAGEYPWPQDLGGRTIQLRTRWGAVTPFGPRWEYDFYNPDPMVQAHIDAVEEMFNVNVRFAEPVTRMPEDVAKRVLAGEEADYFFSGRKYLEIFASMGLVEPLSMHLDDAYYNTLPPSFRPGPEVTDFMGETYIFQAKNYTWHPWSIYWNKSMFEREGLPSLYALYDEGDWTFETMLQLSNELVKDTTGDGELDQFGMNWHRWYFTPPLNDAQLARYVDGRWIATINEPQFIETMEFVQELLEPGQGNFTAGSAGMFPAWADQSAAGIFQEMEDDFGIIVPPRGPSAEDHVSHSAGIHMGYISVGTPNPRAVIEVVSALWMLTEPYMDVTLDEWEERLWRTRSLQVRDRESIEHWQWLMRNVEGLNFWRSLETLGMLEVVDRIHQGESASSVLHEFNPVVQAFLDDLFKQ